MFVDWQTYWDAAGKCHDLADDLRGADKPVHDAINRRCAGMAGDAPGCRQWGQTYDAHTQAILQTCTNLADALTNFGYVLYAAGYNHGLMNKSNPPLPPKAEVTVHTVQAASAVADNGSGLRHTGGVPEFFNQLATTIAAQFGKLPNADIDKLADAATVWSTFAGQSAITGAASRIDGIAGMFADMDEPTTAGLIADHFTTLKSAASQLADSTALMPGPVADYRTSTIDVSGHITSEINTLLIEIGVIAATAVAACWLSFGGSLAAGAAGTTEAVATTLTTIRGLYQASRLYQLLGLTVIAATAVGVVKAFDHLPDLDRTAAALAGIIGLRVKIADDPDHAEHSPPAPPAEGPKNAHDVQDIVKNRAQPGKNKPHRQMQTDREIRQLYDDLTKSGEPIEVGTYPGRGSRLADGTQVRIRDTSESGGVTVEIYYPGRKPVKVHLP